MAEDENTQTHAQEKAEHLTQEPQVMCELDQIGPNDMRNKHEHAERYRDELSSKQQNEKIANCTSNRHSRPSSIGMYGSPRTYIYDPTVGHDGWEDS